MKTLSISCLILGLSAFCVVASNKPVNAASGTKFCSLHIHFSIGTGNKKSIAERDAMRAWHRSLYGRYAYQFDWKQAKNQKFRCKGKYSCQVSAAPCGRFTQAQVARLNIPKSCQTAGTLKRAKARNCAWYAPWKFR